MRKQIRELMLVNRRNNPDYMQVSGLIKKELAVALKFYCVEQEVTVTEGLEQAIEFFLTSKGKLSTNGRGDT